ncbi:hypothetical protein LIU_14075 (plasmid) [Enterococcus durans]|nr:hypothetical protein LIU_14075 [Enterococcus durans]
MFFLSLDTLTKRFDDINLFFKRQPEETISDFEILFELRREIVNLGLENSFSMTESVYLLFYLLFYSQECLNMR